MKWVLVGNLTGAVGEALVRHGHQAHQASELGLAEGAGMLEVLKAAEKMQWDLLTNDRALAEAPFEHHFPFNRTMVYLQLEGGEVEQDDAIDRLFDRYKRLTPRRLYTVTGSRVKIRQLPGEG